MKERQIELLAPAGSYEGFEAAIGAGADAVYVGGAAFGARAYAKNFGEEELLKAIDTAHIHGKKLYLTVNTLLKNREMEERLFAYLSPFYREGLDAVIVQDLGVFSFIKKCFPKLPLHASTQMTVTGPEGMRFLEEKGASRVVAARELSLEELKKMHMASPIEIEAFVHGALCYSYSGQCLMSSIFGGRSGNRGRCAQPCRLPYETTLTKGKYKKSREICPLSLKDINTIEILPEILEAGVTSLKIEGRMKQPEYTAAVTSMYRKYLDILSSCKRDAYHVEERDMKYLVDVFNRGGSCRGYYEMQNGPSMMAFENEKKTGNVSVEIIKRKEKIKGKLSLFSGSPAILEVSLGDICVCATGGEVQEAQNHPMDETRIRQQMEKLGNTPYAWEKLEIEMEKGIFVPVKVLNEVRREALALLEEACLEIKRREDGILPEPKAFRKNTPSEKISLYVSCENQETAKTLLREVEMAGMYLPFRVMKNLLDEGVEHGLEMYLSLPYIVRGEMPEGFLETAREWLSRGMKGFLVRNLESYGMMRRAGLEKLCVLDASVYAWNNESISFWKEEGVMRNTVPFELKEGELRHRDNRDSEMIVYGYIPLMISAQCVQKNLYGCKKEESGTWLKDRYGKEFYASCECRPWKTENTKEETPCYNIIYNSIPYGLLGESRQIKELGIEKVRLSFTVEKADEALKICRDFVNAYEKGKKVSPGEYTKGHFKRGAE